MTKPKAAPQTDTTRWVRDAHPAVLYTPAKYDPKTDPDLQRCACTDPNACPHT